MATQNDRGEEDGNPLALEARDTGFDPPAPDCLLKQLKEVLGQARHLAGRIAANLNHDDEARSIAWGMNDLLLAVGVKLAAIQTLAGEVTDESAEVVREVGGPAIRQEGTGGPQDGTG